jgi:hypothetical protein
MSPVLSRFHEVVWRLGSARIRLISIATALVLSGIVLPAQDLSNPNATSNTRAVYEYLKSVGRAGATTGLTAVASSASKVDLAWRDNSDNETGFRLEQRIGTGAWSALASSPANTQSRNVTGLKPNSTCSFRLRATNVSGDSMDSSIATVTTPAAHP